MSDFDEEAEREKLRERFEREERRRETTEKMSELLLQGATMTNAHCDQCGDPIFRYDGQEFCPTCERAVDRGDGAANATAGADDVGEDADASPHVETASPDENARVRFGARDGASTDGEADGSDATPDVDDATADAEDASTDEGTSADERAETAQSDPHPDTQPDPQPAPSLDPAASGTADDRPAPAAGDGKTATHVANARLRLARTVERFAAAAEETDDPTVATEYLSAAREAAAALDELD